MRILGKGKTALALKVLYPNSKLYDDSDFCNFDNNSKELTIVSPGIPPHNKLVKNTKNIISDYDLLLTNKNLKINKDIFSVWISGTNGKTTTTQMCEHLLKDKDFIACGNIGLPLAKAVQDNYKNLLIESSSYTLHYTSYVKPNIYLLLPISDDHLSWHGSFENYENSKLKPLLNMDENDIAVLPYKYKNFKTNAKLITYRDSNDLASKFNININKIKFKEPFLLDALLALSLDKILYENIDYSKINSFQTDVHKMEEFKNKNGVLYVNDSKGTNVDATIQALKTYNGNKIHIILGGDDKGADLSLLFTELKKHQVIVYSIGTNTNKLYELSNENKIKCLKCDTLLNACEILKNTVTEDINNKTVILLSPAAASFDQFESYIHRGNTFKENIL